MATTNKENLGKSWLATDPYMYQKTSYACWQFFWKIQFILNITELLQVYQPVSTICIKCMSTLVETPAGEYGINWNVESYNNKMQWV